jgi:hypothetical protein
MASPSGIYRWKYRRNTSVGKVLAGIFFLARFPLKYLPPMPQSLMASPLVIYRWKYRRNTSVSKVLVGIFFWRTFPVGKTVSVWFFYFRQNQRRTGELPTIKIPTDELRW